MKQGIITLLVLLTGLFTLTGCQEKTAENTLYIYNWSDYISSETIDRFEKETGIKVVYDVFDSNDTLEAKLMAGNTGYDLVFPTYFPYFLRQVKAGVYQPLDSARIPALKNLDKRFDEPLTIDNNRYGVPFMWGTVGIGYNADAIAKIFGKDFTPDSWSFVFEPENAKKLSACGLMLMNSPIYLDPIMMKYLGLNPKSTAYSDYQKAIEQFSKIQPYVRAFHDSQYINDLANGNICVAVGWSGDLNIARERAKLAAKPLDIHYVNPKEGSTLIFDVMAVPAGAKNIDAAYQFINFILDEKVMAEITSFSFFPSPVLSSRNLLAPDLKNDSGIYPPESIFHQFFVQGELPSDVEKQINRDWAKMKAGEMAHAK